MITNLHSVEIVYLQTGTHLVQYKALQDGRMHPLYCTVVRSTALTNGIGTEIAEYQVYYCAKSNQLIAIDPVDHRYITTHRLYHLSEKPQ